VDGLDPAIAEVHLGSSVLSRDPGQVRLIRTATLDPGYRILPSPVAPTDVNASSGENDLDRLLVEVIACRLASRRRSPQLDVAVRRALLLADAGA
jgi:hypothetical protein